MIQQRSRYMMIHSKCISIFLTALLDLNTHTHTHHPVLPHALDEQCCFLSSKAVTLQTSHWAECHFLYLFITQEWFWVWFLLISHNLHGFPLHTHSVSHAHIYAHTSAPFTLVCTRMSRGR